MWRMSHAMTQHSLERIMLLPRLVARCQQIMGNTLCRCGRSFSASGACRHAAARSARTARMHCESGMLAVMQSYGILRNTRKGGCGARTGAGSSPSAGSPYRSRCRTLYRTSLKIGSS
jgi:hypothetical protein